MRDLDTILDCNNEINIMISHVIIFPFFFVMNLLTHCLQGAETAEIKKAYRRLSMIYHPDRETGDSHKFMRITKAYDA